MQFNKTETKILKSFSTMIQLHSVFPDKDQTIPEECSREDRGLYGKMLFTVVSGIQGRTKISENKRSYNAAKKLEGRGLVEIIDDTFLPVHHCVGGGVFFHGHNRGVSLRLTEAGREAALNLR